MSYSELKTPQATFRLIHRGQGDKAFARDWPKKVDLIIPELVHDQPVKELEKRFAEYVAELEANPSFELLSKIAKKTGEKIAFLDLAESQSLANARDYSLGLFEGLAGLFLVFKSLKPRREKKRNSLSFFT